MKLLIIDTETTALKPTDGSLAEVGMIFFSVEHRAVIAQMSFLLPVSTNPAEHVNGIKPALTTCAPVGATANMQGAAYDMACHCDAYVAHNAAFDRQWVEDFLPKRPWICTMDDVEWPGVRKRPALQNVALAYGVPVWAAHRALTDCIYIAQVFERCPNLEELLADAMKPRFLYQAIVSFESNGLAKDAGFSWDRDRRAWTRKMTAEAAELLPFGVKQL